MAADPGPESVVIRKIEYEELDAALSNLPYRYREVLILAEWDRLDRESIAQLEGVSQKRDLSKDQSSVQEACTPHESQNTQIKHVRGSPRNRRAR